MERELERLLSGTTPPTSLPDIEALHRRGVRRRLAVRASAASAVVAVVAVGALALQGHLDPAAIEFGPADQAGGDGEGPPDGSQADGDGRDDGDAGEPRAPEEGDEEAEPPFGLQPEEIAAAAATLPAKGVKPEPEHIDTIRGTDGSKDPDLGASYVGCHFRQGTDEDPDVPLDARDSGQWYDVEATTADLIGGCLEHESLDSTDGNASGPFTVCQAALTPEARGEAIDHEGWEIASTQGKADGYEPVAFPAVLAWEADCAHADPRSHFGETTVGELASLDTYNDRRRVEAAVKAVERDCLSYPEALALGVATAERLDGDWRALGLHPGPPPRTAPCAGLDFNALWGAVMVMPEAYWSRDLPVPNDLAADDARRVGSLGQTLTEALEAGDAAGVAAAVEQVASLEGRTPPSTLREIRATEDGERLSGEAVSILSSALNLGCLEESSAVTLALTLDDLLSVHEDIDRFVGAVAVEDVTDADLDQPEPTCFRVNLTNTASFTDEDDPDPAIVVQPLWID